MTNERDIREQVNRIKSALDEIQAAIDALNARHGIKFAIVQNLRSEQSVTLDKGIDKLAMALNQTARVKDQSVPQITRKEFVWGGIEIKQFPKKIREEYE